MPSRLFLYLPTPSDRQDEVLLRAALPIARTLADDAPGGAFSFARLAEPEPNLRLAAAGEAAWIESRARPLLADLACSTGARIVREGDLADFETEIRRWGGDQGLRLAERVFHADSLACLERIELESHGAAGRSRREWSLLLTDALLDALELTREEKLDVHRRGHAWPLEQGVWTSADLATLESKYQGMKAGLAALLGRGSDGRCARSWGSATERELAERSFERLIPACRDWTEARHAGRLEGDAGFLLWSLAHVQTLRLGIDTIAEAILRYFAFRLLEDGEVA